MSLLDSTPSLDGGEKGPCGEDEAFARARAIAEPRGMRAKTFRFVQ